MIVSYNIVHRYYISYLSITTYEIIRINMDYIINPTALCTDTLKKPFREINITTRKHKNAIEKQ